MMRHVGGSDGCFRVERWREEDDLDEGASDIHGQVTDVVGGLIGEKDGGSLLPDHAWWGGSGTGIGVGVDFGGVGGGGGRGRNTVVVVVTVRAGGVMGRGGRGGERLVRGGGVRSGVRVDRDAGDRIGGGGFGGGGGDDRTG